MLSAPRRRVIYFNCEIKRYLLEVAQDFGATLGHGSLRDGEWYSLNSDLDELTGRPCSR